MGKISGEIMSFKLRSEEASEKKNHGFIKTLAYIACSILLGFIVFSVITTKMQIDDNKQKYEELVQQTEAIEEKNASIERYLEEDANMDEYIEEIARDKLNFANPDERVYYIVPSGN